MIKVGIFSSAGGFDSIISSIRIRPDCFLCGVYININAGEIFRQQKLSALRFTNPDHLTDISDVLIFADNAYFNVESIRKALKKSKHVFLFPDTRVSFYQLEELNKLAEEAGVVFSIWQPAPNAALKKLLGGQYREPFFMSINRSLHREQTLAGRTIIDSLYEEVLFALSLNKQNINKFYTTTVPWCSPGPSFIHVRIEFVNGSTVNLSLNNYTLKNERYTEIFSGDKMIEMKSGNSEINVLQKNPNETKTFSVNRGFDREADSDEGIKHFLESAINGRGHSPSAFGSGIEDHLSATRIIHKIIPFPVNEMEYRMQY